MATPRLPARFLLVLTCITAGCDSGGPIAPGLTEEGVRSLAVGMTEAEVLSLVGEPLWIEVSENCIMSSRARGGEWNATCQEWTYAVPRGFFREGWEALIRFGDDRLYSVSIDNHDLYRRPANKKIYRCSHDGCPEVLDEHELKMLGKQKEE